MVGLNDMLPKFLRFAGTVRVTGHERISPHLTRIRFRGPFLHNHAFTAGDKVKLAVPGSKPKSYTPASYDPDAGTMDVIFHLHGQGTTAAWAAQASVGDEVYTTVPVKSLRGLEDAQRVWLCGDETVLGLAVALHAHVPTLHGALELASDDAGAVGALQLPTLAVPTGTLLDHLPDDPYDAYVLSGEAESLREVHRALLERGVPRHRLLVKPYWSRRGVRHRKEVSHAIGGSR